VRSFYDDGGDRSFSITTVTIGSTLDLLKKGAVQVARVCAQAEPPVVFCPPVASFKSRDNARAGNVAEGVASFL
jgi:hypothetical protein